MLLTLVYKSSLPTEHVCFLECHSFKYFFFKAFINLALNVDCFITTELASGILRRFESCFIVLYHELLDTSIFFEHPNALYNK